MEPVIEKTKIYSIENLRGIAALIVCIFHMTNTLAVNDPVKRFSILGYLGVQIFFVISGFVIPWSLYNTGYKIKNFFTFLLKRLLRIEPPYLLSILLLLFLNYLSSKTAIYAGQPFHINIEQLLLHLVYLPVEFGFDWYQPVYHTLQVEFEYYILLGLIFVILVRNNRLTTYLLPLLLILGFFFIPITLFKVIDQFLIGIFYFKYKIGHLKIWEFWLLEIAVIAFTFFFNTDIFVGIVEILALFGILYWNSTNVVTQFLGKISYSLYLVHIPIGGKIVNFCQRYLHSVFASYLIPLIAIAVSIIFAWVFYKLVELPSIKLSRRVAKKF